MGNGTLHVYINGVRQEPNYGYTETSTTQVTFDSAPALNDVILFLINPFVNRTTADAASVTYDNSASGLTATNAQAAIDELLPKTDATSYGFYTTVNATDPTNDIDISAGQCWDTTRASFMAGSAMTKQGNVAWSAGNNGGFLDTGTISSNEGYHIYAMINDVDGSVDYIMSLSETWSGVTKPTNYTKGQIIGYMARTTAWIDGVWSGNWFQYGEAFYFVNDTTLVSDTLDSYEAWPAPANSMVNIAVQALNTSPTGRDLALYLKRGGAVGSTVSAHGILRIRMDTTPSVDVAQAAGWARTDQNRDFLAGLRFTTTSPVIDMAVSSFVLADRLEATS